MAGIAILVDLWRKNHNSAFQSSSAFSSSSSAAVAAAAAASFAAGTTFASRAFFRIPVAYCDAGATVSEDLISTIQSASEDFISTIQSASERINNYDAERFSTKTYNVQPKPLFSAFELRSLAMTSIRSFLMHYLPLLEPRAEMEDDEDTFESLTEEQPEHRVDLVVPFKKSVKQIIRETSVVTTRRFLERIAVHYVSERMAWKLLKDVPRSATRKAARNMPTYVYFFSVGRTTFRGHMLGVAASWVVQVGMELYRFFRSIFSANDEDSNVDTTKQDTTKQVQLLGQKVALTSIRCSSSLVFASIGAGIGATLVRPSLGQWIGCAAGDLAGPIIVAFCADKAFQVAL
ncbi:hypothetical protein MtrunA17_Chr6g0449901 [Medicago truncatula]|uniref:Uncharacterized protein n=1 Tax=Medicago truncatula TaxID=3880 RepID=G7KHJ0_MEDTR|nr:uncharacterized protein LOC11428426 isoform X1 [Medicago truncatula]AES74402.1 hypothetical protein MTR_6g005540 [Medicago truncatula]RHN49747.1 hypothetical protein MtrunA17_Chr6g0449901 [Medicago truncatula]